MPAALQPYFEWPTLPFSILLCVVFGYWLLVIVSGIDLDVFDLDLSLDTEVGSDGSIFDWGLVGLKWFNLGYVPLMLWVSVFALAAWGTSVAFDSTGMEPTSKEAWTAYLRNVGIGLIVTKLLTQPLKGKFDVVEPNTVADMLGRECVITTTEADEKYGQAQCRADGAPLVLNVRTSTGSVPRGGAVRIVDYSAEDRVYIVEVSETA